MPFACGHEVLRQKHSGQTPGFFVGKFGKFPNRNVSPKFFAVLFGACRDAELARVPFLTKIFGKVCASLGKYEMRNVYIYENKESCVRLHPNCAPSDCALLARG